jgi:class 3 adenylate cyclase
LNAALPSGTVTFVFTDIEGSTRLLQELGDAYATVVSDHRRLVRAAFGEHGGSEIDTQGDAFFYSFPRARDAVAGAVAAQRALHAHDWPDGREPRVRMGVHTGEPNVTEEGYLGLDVVRAARIAGAGNGGQILISETTRALLGNALPEGTAVLDLGDHALKDIQQEHIYELSLDPGNAEARPLKSEKGKSSAELLSERIQAHVAERIEQALTDPFKRRQP